MNETLLRWGAVAVGGGIGAVARYGVGLACARVWGERFGYGTLLVNCTGCFLLGILMHEAWLATAGERGTPSVWHAGLTVGLLGGLTTFSTFGFQTIRHLEAGETMLALLNIGSNVLLGLAAAAAGIATMRSWGA